MLLWLLMLLSTSVGDPFQAPDGRRGFGAHPSEAELRAIFNEREGGLPAELSALGSEVRLLVGNVILDYRRRGYFELLDREQNEQHTDLDALHAAFQSAMEQPFPALNRRGPSADAFARMVLDERFRVRARLLEGWHAEERELRQGVDLLRATTNGWVVLDENERAIIAQRVDLSASLLRALRSDLIALRPGPDDETAGDGEAPEVLALVDLAQRSPKERWREGWSSVAEQMSRRENAMLALLFSERLRSAVAELRAARAKARESAENAFRQALLFFPDSEEGRSAPAEIAELSRGRRIANALYRARDGLAEDPLHEELTYLAAFCTDYQFGWLESRPLYDRYLAMRGIRAHDHRTIQGRKLTPREEEALAVVQRALANGR